MAYPLFSVQISMLCKTTAGQVYARHMEQVVYKQFGYIAIILPGLAKGYVMAWYSFCYSLSIGS
jgi:hypothetical protein